MKDKKIYKVLILALLLTCAFAYRAKAQGPEPVTQSSSKTQLSLASVPLNFEANQGQTDASVKFLSRGDGYALFLTPKEAIFKLRNGSVSEKEPSLLRMELLGANGTAEVTGANQLSSTVNYFIGNDSKKWRTGLPTYGKVNYRGIYPGVDAVFYGNQRELEYDFTVAPGADASRIAMVFSGARPKLDPDGNVLLAFGGDTVTLHKPVFYQGEGSSKKTVDGSYDVAGNHVRLRIGPYDHSQPLVIDPVISYLTYLGGSTGNSGSVAWTSISCRPNACPPGGFGWRRGQGIAVDRNGNVYATGTTESIDFPTLNPLQAANKSAYQWTAYVTKMNPDGTGLVYSTYLGGTGNDEADAIAIDASGNAYVVGETFSGDFPTTSGAYVSQCPVQSQGPPPVTYCQTNGASFLTKLSPDGQSLVYSTFMPFENTASFHSVAVDTRGRAYVAGDGTNYGNSGSAPPDFFYPTTANAVIPWNVVDQAYDPHAYNPGMAFVTVFSTDGSSLLYSTLFGDTNPAAHGTYGDQTANTTHGSGVAVDPVGNFYLVGDTADPNLPITGNAFQKTYSACVTCYRSYVAKFSPVDSANGPQLQYATYLGDMSAAAANQNLSDQIAGVAADANGSAYVTGYTQTPAFPTTSGTFNPGPCGVLTGRGYCPNGAFLTKFTPDGTGLAWSTLVSYSSNTTPSIGAILSPRLDARGNVYVIVQAGPGYFAVNPVQTPTLGTQLGITKVDPTGSKIFFSTLLGSPTGTSSYGGSIQFPGGLDVDPQGNIYVGGMTQGNDLPTTPGAFQTTDPLTSQNWTSFLAKINPFVADTTALGINPTTANVGQTVTFTATVNTNQNGTATGTVNFMNGSTPLGSAPLDSNGSATFSTADLPAGTYSVTAAYVGDDTFGPSTSAPKSLTVVGQAPQTITFGALPTVTYGVAPITLVATASSGLPVSYAVAGPATLNGSILSVTGVGTVSVTASQGGNDNYAPATPVTQSFTVAPAVLTVTANSVGITYGQPVPSLTYTISGFAYLDSIAVVTGNPQESTTGTSTSPTGTYPITITQGTLAAANYTFTFVNGSLTINGGASQTITFGALPNVTYGVAPITLMATASSGLPVSYAVTGPATVSGSILSINGAGNVSVTASQAGNANYAAGTPVTRSFTVSPAVLTVTANNASINYGQAIPTLTYTTTGLVNGDPASVLSGAPQLSTTATATSPAGTYPITVMQGTLAAANYTFTFVNGTLTINGGASQTITFGTLSNVTYGVAPITLMATASSNLPVSYVLAGPATLNGTILTITGAGNVSVTASQPGNANYAAATPVTQSFIVARAPLTVTANNASMSYGQPIPTFTYTVKGFVNGDTGSVLSGAPQESTTATSTSAPGTYPITIGQGTLAATNYTFTFVNATLTINMATQTITFGAIPAQTVGVTVNLSASTSSGLPVSFASLTSPVCTVTGTTAQMVAAGTCSIQASQPGNANYLAATPVTQSFAVSAASGTAFTIDPDPPFETVKRGELAVFVVDVRSVNGFKGNVKLTCSGAPSGANCGVIPQTVYVNKTAYAIAGIMLPKSTTPGTYKVTFTGVSGSLTVTATAQLTVK